MNKKKKIYRFDYSFALNGDIKNGSSFQNADEFEIDTAILWVKNKIAKDETITVSISNEREISEEDYTRYFTNEAKVQ